MGNESDRRATLTAGEPEWGECPFWLAVLHVNALMHLAISMFLLVATGGAAPPPRLTCQNAYQSLYAVARRLHITKGEYG